MPRVFSPPKDTRQAQLPPPIDVAPSLPMPESVTPSGRTPLPAAPSYELSPIGARSPLPSGGFVSLVGASPMDASRFDGSRNQVTLYDDDGPVKSRASPVTCVSLSPGATPTNCG